MKKNAYFFFDLFELAQGLVAKNGDYFNREQEFFLVGDFDSEDGYAVVGLEQALAFLREIYENFDSLCTDIVPYLKINPLVKSLNLDLNLLTSVEKPPLTVRALSEGQRVSKNQPYARFKTTPYLMTFLYASFFRLVSNQTMIVKNAEEYRKLSSAFMNETGGAPSFINLVSRKLYNPSMSAYFARASYLGGIERAIDTEILEAQAKSSNVPLGNNSWYINSLDALTLIKEESSKKFSHLTLSHDAFSRGDVFYLDKERIAGNDLLSFLLDGEIANTISTESTIPHKNVSQEKDDSYVVDAQYQSIFSSKFIECVGVYGVNGTHSIKDLNYGKFGSLRVKHRSIPQLLVNSFDELNVIIEQIRNSFPERDLFFRGQTKNFMIERTPEANNFLYGGFQPQELSLPTSASRTNFDYDTFCSRFQMQIQGFLYSKFFEKNKARCHGALPQYCLDPHLLNTHKKWRDLFNTYEWDLLIMGLAQHYGIPTHGLDVTNDILVAIWFATNKFYSFSRGNYEFSWYRSIDRVAQSDSQFYPVVYMITTDRDLKRDLDQIEYLGLPALRPKRQSAFLHYGGWGLHKNVCAEDVVAAVYLSEKFVSPSLPSFRTLFPSPEEDIFYRELLNFKKEAISQGLSEGYSFIADFAPE